jgi:UDP-N-acetyl-2-amino-2-deoxyglucuronate dehydrogenase
MQSSIKFAIIGFGHIGKRHAAILQNHPNCELVAICDENIASIYPPNIATFASCNELFSNKTFSIDVVIIATPNGLHEAQALKALEMGCHVVIEKPMALTKIGCERIIFKALQRHKQVFCVMQNRYSPISVWLKSLLEAQVLGNIYMVQVNCFWNRDDRYYKKGSWHGTKDLDGGVLFTQFSHFIDLLYWCFGDICNIQAKFNNFMHQHNTDFEDSAFINFDFVDGGMGSIHYSTAIWDKNMDSSVTVIGQNGALKIGGQYMERIEYCHIKNYTLPEKMELHDAKTAHTYIYDNIVGVMQGHTSIDVNALEGMKVVEIIEKIYKLRNN